MTEGPTILECTLRDGSYAIDFQFNADDTFKIAKRLDDLGFPLIEVGHGIGLGASDRNIWTAAATDEVYMAAGARAVVRGRWGMFCIPGIAQISDVELAENYGMGFIRVGTEVGDAEAAHPFIESARTRGMYVFCNLMKSYASTPEYFVAQAGKCIEYGAQCVYIVDSAGGMLLRKSGVISMRCGALIPMFGLDSPVTTISEWGWRIPSIASNTAWR